MENNQENQEEMDTENNPALNNQEETDTENNPALNNQEEMDTENNQENQPIASGEKDSKDFKQRTKSFFSAALQYIKSAKLELILIISVVFLDLITKFVIDKTMGEGEMNVIIKNFLQFRYVHNNKAAFGSAFGLENILGEQGVMTLFIMFSSVAICVFCYLLYRLRKMGLIVRLSLALIIGGAFGNLYDRLAFSYVRDFVEIVFFGLDIPLLGRTFAIFNLADAALVIGMILMMFFFLFIYKDDKSKQNKQEKNNQIEKQAK